MIYDYIIVGGGIVGLATAHALKQQRPGSAVVVLEKEATWAFHQTGRNSGVIHSGIYYKPESLKAKMAVDGRRGMVAFCEEHGIRHEICGKVIVATKKSELEQLEILYQRGLANGVTVKKITSGEVAEIEPSVSSIAGIYVRDAGVVDYKQVSQTLVRLLSEAGTELRLSARVRRIAQRSNLVAVETQSDAIQGRLLVNCGGLQSDRLTKMSGIKEPAKIIPFRGEYFTLRPEKSHLVRNLVYPVPDPTFPFLGVHLTRSIDGSVHAGPNAVLSLKREGYSRRSMNACDVADIVFYLGFWRLAAKYWRTGVAEMARSASKTAFVRDLRQLVPDINADDLLPAEPGVRAQAVRPDGGLVDDFLIVTGPNMVHVCNAPSPAATASLEIGRYVAGKLVGTG